MTGSIPTLEELTAWLGTDRYAAWRDAAALVNRLYILFLQA